MGTIYKIISLTLFWLIEYTLKKSALFYSQHKDKTKQKDTYASTCRSAKLANIDTENMTLSLKLIDLYKEIPVFKFVNIERIQ